MHVPLTSMQWAQSFVITCEKQWSVMLTTLQSKVVIRTTISMTWERCSISCGLTSWTRQSPSWEFQAASPEFIVTSKGIHLDSSKIKAIQVMQPPKNLKELRGLQGRLAYIRRFIINLSGHCQPFTRLIKKGVSFIWDDACQKSFENIKEYLNEP